MGRKLILSERQLKTLVEKVIEEGWKDYLAKLALAGAISSSGASTWQDAQNIKSKQPTFKNLTSPDSGPYKKAFNPSPDEWKSHPRNTKDYKNYYASKNAMSPVISSIEKAVEPKPNLKLDKMNRDLAKKVTLIAKAIAYMRSNILLRAEHTSSNSEAAKFIISDWNFYQNSTKTLKPILDHFWDSRNFDGFGNEIDKLYSNVSNQIGKNIKNLSVDEEDIKNMEAILENPSIDTRSLSDAFGKH